VEPADDQTVMLLKAQDHLQGLIHLVHQVVPDHRVEVQDRQVVVEAEGNTIPFIKSYKKLYLILNNDRPHQRVV